MKTSEQDHEDGTIGFNPQLSGRGKAGKSHTSSFGNGLPHPLPKSAEELAPIHRGQEEGGRMRHPASSAAGRILPQGEKPGDPPAE